jgi:AcrR family transcriptional regulator
MVVMTTAHSGSGDIRRGLKLLWGMKEAPTRGPKPGLTLLRIVETAVHVADTEGLEAVSMRRVATDLGVGTMSLYRYVPGKSELLELMLDHVEKPGPHSTDLGPHDGWRTVMEAVGRGTWELHLAHPWLLQVNTARPLLGPNAMAGFDFAMAALEGTGLTDQERLGVIVGIDSFVRGSAHSYVNGKEAAKRTGISDSEFWTAQAPFLSDAMNSGAYPALAKLSAETFAIGGDRLFEFGLVRLLDGIGDYIDAVAQRRSSPEEPAPSDSGTGDA